MVYVVLYNMRVVFAKSVPSSTLALQLQTYTIRKFQQQKSSEDVFLSYLNMLEDQGVNELGRQPRKGGKTRASKPTEPDRWADKVDQIRQKKINQTVSNEKQQATTDN